MLRPVSLRERIPTVTGRLTGGETICLTRQRVPKSKLHNEH